MEHLLIRTSRKQAGQFIIVGGAMVLGVLLLAGPSGPWVALKILLFVVIAPVLAWQWFDRRPRLVLDEQGLSGIRMGRLLIPWSDVRDVELRRLAGLDHIYVHFSVIGQATPTRRAILASDLELKAVDLVRAIRERAKLESAVKSAGP